VCRVRPIATNGTLDIDFDGSVAVRTVLLPVTALATQVARVVTQGAIEHSELLQLLGLVLLVRVGVWVDHHGDLVGSLVD